MSENKYIIDKDSLTGIADAVRDKLGTGEATTDETTGEIVYPKDKGYYLKDTTVAKISGFGWSREGYNGNFGQNYSPRIESADWDEAVGEPWYSVEITLVNVSGNDSYNMSVQYSGGSQEFTTVRSSTYTVSVPNGSTYFNLYFYNTYSYSRYNGSSSLGSLTAIFKDVEGKPIRPKQSSYQCHWSNVVRTANFGSVGVETQIPFTINDIQDKITNYLEEKSTIKSKLFITRYNSSTTQAQYGEYANYLWATSTYNYNVGPSDPTYITTKIPNLRPENIIYMAVITANNNEKKYQFRSEKYPMQHYTTLSQSGSGKRLTTATDYYFFPNGCVFKNYSENYGLLAHWDENNSILDLQGVLKSSGTIDGTITASSSAYLNPYMLYIIYEEVTE